MEIASSITNTLKVLWPALQATPISSYPDLRLFIAHAYPKDDPFDTMTPFTVKLLSCLSIDEVRTMTLCLQKISALVRERPNRACADAEWFCNQLMEMRRDLDLDWFDPRCVPQALEQYGEIEGITELAAFIIDYHTRKNNTDPEIPFPLSTNQ